jgi:beta-lactamase superfamily II metal-dependent hydrolase
VRSTIMMSVIIGGWVLRRPSDLLNSLGAAAFLILIWDPLQLFQAGFQLSFSVVLSLALFLPPLNRLRDRWLEPDPLLPAELRPAWQQWLLRGARWLLSGVATSVAAFIGAAPLVAWYFHLFTPVSLLANVLVVPASSAALAAAVGSLAVGAWWPWLGELFNHSAWFFVWLMTRLSQWAADLPGGCFYVPAPTLFAFLLYYGALAGGLAGWWQRPRARRWFCAVLGVVAVAMAVEWHLGRRGARLTLVPLQGGELARLDAPGRDNDALVDCGNDNAVEFLVKPFLRSEGVNRLPRLLLTHGDARQVGGASALLERFPATEMCVSTAPFRSPAYRELRVALDAARQPVRELRAGDRVGPWTVLHPAVEDRFSQADDAALVLHASLEGIRVLLLSDLGRPGQNALLARHPDLRADIVVSGLPAQGEPVADALLDTLRPRLIVVTDSEYPATARAGRRLRERLAGRDVTVLYTMEAGAVTLRFRDGGWSLRTASGVTMNAHALRTPARP